MRTTLAAVTALLLLALSAVPASADVAEGWEERSRNLRLSFELPAGNGYTMSVSTKGHRQVTLSLSKGTVSASYKTTGKVSRNGIEADFGALGEISVEFAGERVERPGARERLDLPRQRCVGRRPQREQGKFRGTISFDGERGYANVDRTSAKGDMERTYRRICQKRRGAGVLGIALSTLGRSGQLRHLARKQRSVLDLFRMNMLSAGGVQDGRAVYFIAFQLIPSRDLGWLAKVFGSIAVGGTVEHREGVQISRVLIASAGTKALVVSKPEKRPTTASVVFPRPLVEGRAELLQTEGQPVGWTGSMALRLPGAGAVPVTGPGISAVLCRVSLFDTLETPCAQRSEDLFPDNSFGAGLLLLS